MMSDRYQSRTVHLGGCELLGSLPAVRRFMEQTGVRLVTGYTKPVEWIPSAALELLWFSSFQADKDIEAIWEEFGQTHLGLIRTNGMKAVVASKGD